MSDGAHRGPKHDVPLLDYLHTLDVLRNELPTEEIPDVADREIPERAPLRALVDVAVSPSRRFALRYALQHHYTSALRFRERRRAAGLAKMSPLLLHLGCGPHPKSGWINIDLAGHPVDLRWNLERPLPFGPETVDGIFHEHLLEHLPLQAGLEFLRANHRLLRSGGVLRVVVPDAGAYADSYADGGSGLLQAVRSDRPTNMLAINELFYMYTHAAMYDGETLSLFLRAAGFDVVEVKSYAQSRLDPCPDSEHRRPESLYVEAIK